MADPVLLTGASGFVGRAILAELVALGIPVIAISRRAGPNLPGVTWHQADLLTAQGRDAVAGLAPRMIHCAWEVEHGAFWTSPLNEVWHSASVDLTRRFLAAGGQRVLALGTCAEYDALTQGPWDEARPIAPVTPYGKAKAALFADLTGLCGPNLVWARLFHLYGPGEDRRRLIPALIHACAEGRPAEVRAQRLVRDFASSAHIARGLIALLDTTAAGPFNIGSGSARTLGDLARIVADATGRADLLRLSHTAKADDPAVMVPDLTRFLAATGLMAETPEVALARHVATQLPG